MTTPELVAPTVISLKNHPTLNEKWLQERLIENPSLLGLGDLEVRSSERRQPSGGRLDLMLQDVDSSTRYEVEIQLGTLDESHIIRTIEYWDIERRRYPQYEHVAVIVAEDVTSRFLNVISLFNRAIPLIAIQLKGVEVNGAFTLIATRVLDLTSLGTDEEDDPGETVGRDYWEKRASSESLRIMDHLIRQIGTFQPGTSPNFNKNYIGIAVGGIVRNFITFHPRKSYVVTAFRIPSDESLTARLDDSGLDMVPHNASHRSYRLRINQQSLDEHRDTIGELIEKAHRSYFG